MKCVIICLLYSYFNKGGRKKIKSYLKQSIEEHMQQKSSLAANRFKKKNECCVYYRDHPLLEIYGSFIDKKDISFSSFYKYMSSKYKKPHRMSEFCGFCEKNKVKFSLICLKYLTL